MVGLEHPFLPSPYRLKTERALAGSYIVKMMVGRYAYLSKRISRHLPSCFSISHLKLVGDKGFEPLSTDFSAALVRHDSVLPIELITHICARGIEPSVLGKISVYYLDNDLAFRLFQCSTTELNIFYKFGWTLFFARAIAHESISLAPRRAERVFRVSLP